MEPEKTKQGNVVELTAADGTVYRIEYDPNAKPIWEKILEIARELPDDVVAQLPTDGAEQHDHYIYGLPKRDE
jgi:hypothetical protein